MSQHARSSLLGSCALLVASCSVDPGFAIHADGSFVDDATIVDASAFDAASDDAAIEAGIADAGPRDAGVRDAGPRDAGMDAGIRDAGMPRPEPTLSVAEAAVDAALHCPETFAGAYAPVLLVHGTGANADVAWDWGYARALRELGLDVCTIDLPSFSWEDIPRASEYVVLATRRIAMRSGEQVALVGHSQGSLEIGWALTFWPSLRPLVADAVYLGAVTHGAAQAATTCGIGFCRVATWQMKAGSAFLTALVRDDETPGNVPHSSIASTSDTTAVAPTSVLAGATNVTLQTLCPGRNVSHGRLLSDAVAFALVLDAITNEGPVDPARVGTGLCTTANLPGVSDGDAGWNETRGVTLFTSTYLGGAMPTSEPALPAYALP